MHGIHAARIGADIYMLDTGRHFPETLETLAETEQRYDTKIRVISPEATRATRGGRSTTAAPHLGKSR